MWGVGPISGLFVTESTPPPRDSAIAELATRQHGVVALGQLRLLGLGESGVRKRVARGQLHRVHRGVYAVGHLVLSVKGRWMAAVLACGPGAVLSHRSAAELWDLRPVGTRLDVTASARAGRSRPGLEAHRSDTLAPADVTTVDGIPCTTVPRTLLDLAEVVNRRVLEKACEQAEVLRVLDLSALEDLLQRTEGRQGAPLLSAAVSVLPRHPELTRSELEQRFLALCRAAELPRPQPNAWLPIGLEVDFLWPSQRLVAETDGHAYHRTRRAFERDRRRDQRLLMAGFRVARFTWRQVLDDPAQVARTVEALLAR